MMVISTVFKYLVLIGFVTICVSNQICLENCAHGTEAGICESETCLTGCKTGWYGPRCSKRCSPKCQASVCEQTDGSCTFGCKYSARDKSRKCTSVGWKKSKRSSNDLCLRNVSSKCECCKAFFRGDNCQFACDNCLTYVNEDESMCRYMCKPGYYGITCNNRCPQNCARGHSDKPLCEETNQHGNGGTHIKCSNGCLKGYYGDLCSNMCSRRCKNNTCYQGDGECVKCPDTFYGINCDLPCSSRCLQGICHKNGTCIKGCKDDICEEICPSNCAPGPDKTRPCSVNENDSMQCMFQCQNGYYGLECDKRCMENCPTCIQTSGVCLTCERGWYGEYCNGTCGDVCRDGACFGNGTCKVGCNDGFQLSESNDCVVRVTPTAEESSASNASAAVAVAVPLVIVGLLVVAAVVIYKLKKKWILSRCRKSNQMTRNHGLGTSTGDEDQNSEELRQPLRDIPDEDLPDVERVKSFRRFQNYFKSWSSRSQNANVEKVQQMPELGKDQQPTIAIIATLEAGKEAVDAMLDNCISYQIGNKDDPAVYTIGNIGCQKVVTTKLVLGKDSKDVRVLEGGFTTRFLGKFKNVNHIFLVGVGGGVRKTDNTFSQIFRGDVVVSLSREGQEAVYYHYGDTCQEEDGNMITCVPRDTVLQDICKLMEGRISVNSGYAPWTDHMQQGLEKLRGQRGKFTRPSEYDENSEEIEQILSDEPKVHFGPIASCSEALCNDSVKLPFVTKYRISAFECRYEHVIDSICGNAKDSYMLVIGVADFKNGSLGKEWEAYASLAAASVVKTIIVALDSQ